MGFSLTGFAVGAAENVAESLKDERERAQKLVDDSLSAWTELGLDEHRNRKIKRKTLTQQATTLKSNGFTPDMMDVIFREGSGEQVIKHIETMKQRNSPVTAADIVKFTPGVYEKSGKTQEQVIDEVMGKIDRGMTASDAIADATGTDSRGVFGIQNLSGIMKRRTEAFSNAMGLDATDMRALAMQDFDYGDAVQGGSVNLVDPVAESQAEEAIRGKGIKSTHETIVGRAAANYFRVTAKEDQLGNFTGFGGDNPAAIAAANRATLEAANKYEELLRTGKYSIPEVRLMLDDYVKQEAEKFLALPPPPQGKLDRDGKVIPGSNSAVSLPNYSGVPLKELGSRITTDLNNVPKGPQRDAMVQHAQKTLQAAIMAEEGATESEALRQAVTRLKNLMGNL
tara:strand:- start:126 stop:1316 length:1191 start_codon:yes stop_codon:yes gene_type:complete